MRSHSYRITTRRTLDGSIVKTVTCLHPAWRRLGRGIALLVFVTWPLAVHEHHGTISPLGWVLFAVWVPVALAVAWVLARRSSR